jgi:methionyl-tRNA synthetase
VKEEPKQDEQITFEDFMKVQLKVAEVIAAEKLEKSEKLLKLLVKIGNEERQIIAGIAKSYKPEDLINKKVVVVANLKPAKLMGLESQGMILAAEDEKGGLKVLSFDEMVKSGVRVK